MCVLIPQDLSSTQGAIFRKCAKERTCEYAGRRESLSLLTKVLCRAVWWASNFSITKQVYYVKGKVFHRAFEWSRFAGRETRRVPAWIPVRSDNSPTLYTEGVQRNGAPGLGHPPASGARQTGKNEPSEPRDLAGTCSGGKFVVSRGTRSVRCTSQRSKSEIPVKSRFDQICKEQDRCLRSRKAAWWTPLVSVLMS